MPQLGLDYAQMMQPAPGNWLKSVVLRSKLADFKACALVGSRARQATANANG